MCHHLKVHFPIFGGEAEFSLKSKLLSISLQQRHRKKDLGGTLSAYFKTAFKSGPICIAVPVSVYNKVLPCAFGETVVITAESLLFSPAIVLHSYRRPHGSSISTYSLLNKGQPYERAHQLSCSVQNSKSSKQVRCKLTAKPNQTRNHQRCSQIWV